MIRAFNGSLRRLLVTGAFCCLLTGLKSAPVDLSTPSNSLGASDAHGHLKLWREIADVNFGNGLVIPLRFAISSESRGEASPLGAASWCPMLSSRAYLKREKMLRAELPCGKVLYLRKDPKIAGKFKSLDGDWVASLQQQTITIQREDGWMLEYFQGHLKRLRSDTGRVIVWSYNGKGVTEIRENGSGRAAVQVNIDPATGLVKALEISGQTHSLELTAGDPTAMIQQEPSLSRWIWPDGKDERYVYRDERGGSIHVLDLKDREGVATSYAWNPETGKILAEGDWRYTVGSTHGEFELPELHRVNSAHKEEFLKVDSAKGVAERKDMEGGHRISTTFKTSGPLYGKVRKIEKVENGARRTVYLAAYDERGRLIRETDERGQTTVLEYAADGHRIGRRKQPTRDAETIKALEVKEQVLIKAAVQVGTFAERIQALHRLGMFYVHEMKNLEKAAALVEKIEDRGVQFNILCQMVDHGGIFTPVQQVAEYQKLLKRFPEQSSTLNFLTKIRQEEYAQR